MKFTEKYAHLIEIVENWDDRAEEFQSDCWKKPRYSPSSYQLFRLNDPTCFRLRPEPKLVKFGPDDIKPGMVFRHKDWPPDVRRQWWQASLNVVEWHNHQQCTYEDMRKFWLWSTDGVKWNKCEKEATNV